MSVPPSGTVTFLFADLEGSTRLWERHPDAMQSALARQNTLLRDAVGTDGGHVVKLTGDGVHAAFATASSALAAALSAQRALFAEPWRGVEPLRVRMALHTGAAELRDGDYYGPSVNRAARLMAVAHGGQLLVSASTQELVRDALPPGTDLRELPEARLADLQRPERVFQLVAHDLPAEFPPLRTLDARPNNLPIQPNLLIGREAQIEAVRQRLLRPDVRLLTLTGPGGTGKTRLALQVAAEVLGQQPDGVFLVALAPITDPDLVAPTIAQALGLREGSAQPLLEMLKGYLRDKQLLLLLDNFEQVLPAAAVVGDVLAACPRLKVLVTSREALRLYAEHEMAVPPLALPGARPLPALERLTQYEAVRLFVERAQAVREDFAVTNENAPAVAEVCHRLDGLPLAIELAAARVRLLSPQALLPRLERRLAVLTGGARDLPARQRTLRATIAWSYDLLDEAEQGLFRRLGVFVGGFTLEAAERVVAEQGRVDDVLDGLESLVAKSLVQRGEGTVGAARFTMLETVREYAREQLLGSGEAAALQRAHAEHYLAVARRAEVELMGPEQLAWLDRLEAEQENLRAALEWSLEVDPEPGLYLSGSLWRFWLVRGHLSEVRERTEALLRRQTPATPTPGRLRGLHAATLAAFFQGDLPVTRRHCEEGAGLYERVADRGRVDLGLHCRIMVALVTADEGNRLLGAELCGEVLALAREQGDGAIESVCLMVLGNMAHQAGEYRRAIELLEQALQIMRRSGDTWIVTHTLSSLGLAEHGLGDYAAARARFEECLAARRALRDPWGIAASLDDLADALQGQGELAAAGARYQESLELLRELGDLGRIARVLEGLARVLVAQGAVERAVRLAAAAAALRDATGARASAGEQERIERMLSAAQRELRVASYAPAWGEGWALSLADAIDLALAPLPAPASAQPGVAEPTAAPLSAREREVAALVARGLTNRQIAEELIISERTADRHVANILSKLGLATRAQIAAWAVGRGIATSRANAPGPP